MAEAAVEQKPPAAKPADIPKDPKAQAALDDKAREIKDTDALKTLIGGDPPKEKPKEKTDAEKIYPDPKDEKKDAPKTEEKKTEPEKKDEKKSAEIKYELKLPKDSLLDQAEVDAIASFAKEKNIAPDIAQRIVEEKDMAVRRYVDTQTANLRRISSEQWPKELEAHPDFGGKRFTETVELAKRAFHAYASKSLIAEMDRTGLGNHPEHLIAWARVGRAMADDRIIPGGLPTQKPKTLAERLYGGKGEEK